MTVHKFWSTQPIDGSTDGPIKMPTDIPKDPYQLHDGNYFVTLTTDHIDEIYTFLFSNYVEDQSQNFRLCYSKDFVLWQLNSPAENGGYIVGVRNKNVLVGFVAAREHEIVINAKNIKMVSVNYLCIAKQLRGKYYAPMIIKEITRRANLNGVYQAVFTGGSSLPNKLTVAKYYHRLLNVDRLVEMNFCDSSIKMKLPFKFLYFTHKIRHNTTVATKDDLAQCHKLLEIKTRGFMIYEKHSLQQFIYNHESREDVVYSLVHKERDTVTAFGSFFIINTRVIEKSQMIKTAYLYYHAGESQIEMVRDLVACARDLKCDVFNLNDIMNNHDYIHPLGFREGDTDLNYYLYNWHAKGVTNRDIHLSFP